MASMVCNLRVLRRILDLRRPLRELPLGRPVTWSLQRGLHSSLVLNKKRKTLEEKKAPKIIKYSVKSKWKQGDVVEVWRNITVRELAEQMGKSVDHVFNVMEFVNNSAPYQKPNSEIADFKVVEEIVKKSGFRYKTGPNPALVIEERVKIKDAVQRDRSKFEATTPRPPVVTIMGHVDHGKTTLLDFLRNSRVVDQEFGGITQHIGAFSVVVNGKEKVTFLDTPGHAAFCAMRNRGAQCTDIVVLVVAADDGVMEQTVESIRMAQEAGVPIIVAINKVDKPKADVEGTKKALLRHGIIVEESGGDVQVVPISALKGTNVNILVDAILAQAELMELETDYEGPAEAVVLESCTDPHRGKLCTVLVECGTLKRGTVLVAGTSWGKVRAMFDDKGEPLREAPPSTPVQILGWRELPSAGDLALEVDSEKRASEVVEWRQAQKMATKMEEDSVEIQQRVEEHYKVYREKLEAKRRQGRYRIKPDGPRKKQFVDEDTGPMLRIIVKGDVDGSVEAILDVLDSYNSQKCKLDIVHYGVGSVSIHDITLAQTFSAIIYTFNIDILEDAKLEAAKTQVSLRRHNVIYKLVDALKEDLDRQLPFQEVEEVIGEANFLQEFLVNDGKAKVPVAGCRCVKGSLKKSALFKVLRRDEVVFQGPCVSLKHLKDEVDSIKKDLECGIRLSDSNLNFEPGDVIQCYKINQVPQKIDWDPGF